MFSIKLVALVFVVLCVNNTFGSKLNVPRVLLPVFDTFSVNFNIEVTDDGCYKWSIFRGDNIVKLVPLDVNPTLGCSGKASVSSISNDKVRQIAIIFAEDTNSGETIRCDVIVDTITSLQIVTKTRELFVGDAPELFEVSAFDDQGNQFTTLDGVEFEWSLKVLRSPINTVLKFIPFKDSSYRTPPDLYELDQKNKQGHMVLVEGVKTGLALVSVKLSSSDEPITQVELSVIANLRLEPTHIVILPGDLIQIDIYQIQNEKLVKIQLPSNQYSIETDPSTSPGLIKIENDSGLFKGLKTGQVRLNLIDYHAEFKNDTIPKSISSFISISNADYLSIVVKPYNRQNLIINGLYELEVHLFNNYNHSISIGPNVKIMMQIPEEYFKVLNTVNNGSYVIVQPIKLGTPNIEASLVEPFIDSRSSARTTLSIYSKVKVTPDVIVFPWHANQNSGLQFSLKASGGDRKYSWNTNDATVSTVSSSGIVTAQGLGKTYVSAAMTRDSSNQDGAYINVLLPDNLKIIAQPAEQEVGKSINLFIQLFVKLPGVEEEISFTTCNHNQFKIEIEDSQFTLKNVYTDSHLHDSCTVFSLSSESVATTKITVYFHTSSTVLKAMVFVSTYKKLVPLRPESKRTVLAPGSSTTLLFYGGPQPWLSHSADYKVKFVSDENLVTFKELPVVRDVDGHKTYAYSVTCESLGSTLVNLSIISIPIVNQIEPETISQTSVKVLCAAPKFVKVFLADTEDNCPISKLSNNIFAYIHDKLFIRVNVIDKDGNIFDNATMINASWVITKSDFVRVVKSFDLSEITEYGFSFPDYHYSVLEPLNKEGSTEVVFQLTGYKKSFFVPNSSRFSSFLTSNEEAMQIIPTIKHSISLHLFDNPRLTREEMLVIHNPKITKSIFIHHGSGYFKTNLSTQKVANVLHNGGRQIDITPLDLGDLEIGIQDLCIKSKLAKVTFKVRNIHRMELLTNTFVEIGQTLRAIVKLYDSEGHSLPIQSDVNIQPVVEIDSMLIIKSASNKPQQIYETEFSIMGSSLGKTNLYFVAVTHPTKEIRTPTTSIQVYSQLQLSPKNLTLAVGSSYQLTVSGGPHLECVFEFVSDDEQVTKVSNEGIAKGLKIGTVTITGMAVGVDVISGMKIVYSKDIIMIRVIKLNNVKIEVPLLKIKIGEVMPAWVRGVPDALSPIIIGTIQPSLIFHWTTSSAGIIQIHDILENTGILVREQDRISIRIRAVRAGNTRLSVSVSDPSTKVIFSNFIDITVYEELHLISHDLLLNSLLVTQNTEFTLTTNKNKVAKQLFQIVGSSKFEKNHVTPLVSVDANSGIVKTTNELGHTHVSIISTEDFDIVQSLDVPIEVKQVNYVMINIETNINSKEPSHMSVLPSGMNLKLITSYHDEKGVQFNAVNSNLQYLTSQQNKMSMTPGDQKHVMEVSLFESGEVILKIWDGGVYNFKEDYIKFHVEHLIYPNKATVTVGDVICFLMPVKFSEENTNEWLSDNVKTLTIESSGFGVALAPSEVFVTYSNNRLSTSTSINILPIKTIKVLPLENNMLSNSVIVDIPLILLNEHESISLIKHKKGNMWEWRDDDCSNRENSVKRFPFVCNIYFESLFPSQGKTPSIGRVFDVSPHFNTKTGFYSCRLSPLPIIDQELSIFQAKIVIQVSAGNVFTEHRNISFLPSVFVNKKELFFGQFSGKDKLIIVGLPQVLLQIQVTSSNNSLVLPVLSSESENKKIYLFDVNDDFWNLKTFDLHILVSSNLTYQNIKIPVVTSRSLNDYDFSRTKLSNANQQDISKIQQSTIFSLFSGFSNSIFSNPYIIGLVTVIITSLIVYCYGFSFSNKFITLIKSPQTPPSPTNMGFYNRSYSSDQNSRSTSLGLNRSLTRMK